MASSWVYHLPLVNATLNGLSAILLLIGFLFIRRKYIAAHRICMLSAFAVSSLFLISYITYHLHVGSKHFPGTGWIRSIYFGILISHTTLALVTVPLVLITLTRALKGSFERHKQIAKWTFPIWLYVSVTGVVVYWMLYKAPIFLAKP